MGLQARKNIQLKYLKREKAMNCYSLNLKIDDEATLAFIHQEDYPSIRESIHNYWNSHGVMLEGEIPVTDIVFKNPSLLDGWRKIKFKVVSLVDINSMGIYGDDYVRIELKR